MQIINLDIGGAKLYIPEVKTDTRGSFVEKMNTSMFDDLQIKQINQSISHKNVFRGFHFQDKPYQQAKYIWVESGKIYDIIINVDSNSNFYKKSLVIELDSKNNRHLFIPKGFAHGFISVMNNTKVCYAVDSFYNPSSDTGINFDDKSLKIDWPTDKSKLLISEKDKNLPFLNEK